MPYQASYAATKAFVLSFTEALAEELRGTGVHVMAAHPGAIATGFFDGTSATIDPRAADTPTAVAARTLDDYARRRAASYPGRVVNRVLTLARSAAAAHRRRAVGRRVQPQPGPARGRRRHLSAHAAKSRNSPAQV